MRPIVGIVAFICLTMAGGAAFSQENGDIAADETRCIWLELYVRNNCSKSDAVAKSFNEYAGKRKLRVRTFNLDEPGSHNERFQRVLHYFKLDTAEAPAIYGCNSILLNLQSEKMTEQALDTLLTADVFVRSGCERCAGAKRFLPRLEQRFPALRFKYHDVVDDSRARDRVQHLADRYKKQAVSVPVFYFCNQLIVGWNGEESTGRQLETELNRWSTSCRENQRNAKGDIRDTGNARLTFPEHPSNGSFLLVSHHPSSIAAIAPVFAGLPSDTDPDSPIPGADESLLPPPPSGESASSVTDDGEIAPLPASDGPPLMDEIEERRSEKAGGSIQVPILGELNYERLGMPAFTFLIGLVDGFNPCAMWVLLFLLSVLVNIRSRPRILAVAGTFVVISGLAYFAFMAAWLNVFLLVGYLRWAQIVLGIVAVAVGTIHVKDFFAFKKGFSLSIPESAKPGIYARVRKIVTAENMAGAIAGAIALAILVNIIELLCTAGLPALYTEILTMQGYPAWQNYLYLGLYNVAYMLDDTILVACVVITLGRHKLQEHEGRWLKLFSGAVILALGLIMISKPDLLV